MRRLLASQKGLAPIVFLLVSVFVVLIIGGGGYYYMNMQNADTATESNEERTLVSPEPLEKVPATQSSSSAQVATTSLKTYENAKYNFSFQYPENWVFSVTDSDILDIHVSNIVAADGPQCTPGFAGIEVQVGHKKGANEKFDTLVREQVSQTPGGLTPSGTLEKFIINGKTAFKVQNAGWGSGCKGPGYFIEQDSTAFIYVFTGSASVNSQLAETQTLTQIVNSITYK